MLGDANVSAVLAVKDLEQGKKFYEDTLGLKLTKESPAGIQYGSGNSSIFVYQSDFAGTNKATAAGWEVDDIEGVVTSLKSKGVTFEHYADLPGVNIVGDIHVFGPMKAAWFKDPTGNILSIGNAF